MLSVIALGVSATVFYRQFEEVRSDAEHDGDDNHDDGEGATNDVRDMIKVSEAMTPTNLLHVLYSCCCYVDFFNV